MSSLHFYELVIIVRHDVATTEVDRITDNLTAIIAEEHSGNVVKTEYWGLRSLAYPINNNKKGHYMLLGISTPKAGLAELERKIKLNENIIRFMIIKVDAISNDPSPILKTAEYEVSNNVRVNQPQEPQSESSAA
jgi:small subunit ribosomal protein S6